MEPTRSVFSVYRRDQLLGEIILRVPGRHNIANALAAIAACSELEVPFPAIADALRDFRGVGRRFEFIAEVNGITIIDDYAHHPSEINATLAAARVVYPGRRVIAVFQPHLFSRTQQFVGEFAQALSQADLCFLTDIYPAREQPIPGVTSEIIKAAGEKSGRGTFRYVGIKDNAVAAITETARSGDVVILIGAGSITYIKHVVADRLRGK
jgi:UDP-N-acetylmuramate--alanine ligase